MTTVTAIAGIVLVAAWLGWRAWVRIRNRPMVAVRTGYAWPTYGEHGDPLGERLVQVTAHNSGRAPVQITSWGFATPGDGLITAIDRIATADPLPHILAPGSEAHWFIRYSEVLTCVERGHRIDQLRARVVLGNGKTVRAPQKGIGTSD
jgi:hypothetical protein